MYGNGLGWLSCLTELVCTGQNATEQSQGAGIHFFAKFLQYVLAGEWENVFKIFSVTE